MREAATAAAGVQAGFCLALNEEAALDASLDSSSENRSTGE